MRQRILIPLDGSKLAEEAIARLQALFSGERTQVHLLTVLPDIERLDALVQFPLVNRELQKATEAAQKHQEQYTRAYLDMVAWSLEDAGYEVETHIVYGQPASGIVYMAQAIQADLIIMTSHGRGANAQWRYGGVTERVLDACDTPVMVVPVRKRLIAAKDASEEAEMAA